MKNTLVIHHSADLDGLCSREVARHSLGEAADYLGWDYGQSIPDLSPYETVYLIDISLPIDVMRENAAKLILIDHHRTLIAAVEPFKSEFKGYYCIDGVAACRLAWQWFLQLERKARGMIWLLPDKLEFVERRVTEPYAVQLLGEYDIWDKRSPYTDPFQLGMQAQKSPDWDCLLQISGTAAPGSEHVLAHYLDTIVENGRAIQSYLDTTNAQISTERGFDVVFEGLTFRALNIARCNSMTFTASIKPHHDGCLGYFWDGKKWKFSLYGVPHKTHLDLSVIAQKYGGGGHRQACGYQMDALPAELGGGGILC